MDTVSNSIQGMLPPLVIVPNYHKRGILAVDASTSALTTLWEVTLPLGVLRTAKISDSLFATSPNCPPFSIGIHSASTGELLRKIDKVCTADTFAIEKICDDGAGRLVVGDSTGLVSLVDVASGRGVSTVSGLKTRTIRYLEEHHGKPLCIVNGPTIRKYGSVNELRDGSGSVKPYQELHGHSGVVSDLSHRSDTCECLVSVSSRDKWAGLWDFLSDPPLVGNIPLSHGFGCSVCYAENLRTLLVAEWDGVIETFDLRQTATSITKFTVGKKVPSMLVQFADRKFVAPGRDVIFFDDNGKVLRSVLPGDWKGKGLYSSSFTYGLCSLGTPFDRSGVHHVKDELLEERVAFVLEFALGQASSGRLEFRFAGGGGVVSTTRATITFGT